MKSVGEVRISAAASYPRIMTGSPFPSIGEPLEGEAAVRGPPEDQPAAGKCRAQRESGGTGDSGTRDEIARVMLADRDAREEDKGCQSGERRAQARHQHAERQGCGRDGVGMARGKGLQLCREPRRVPAEIAHAQQEGRARTAAENLEEVGQEARGPDDQEEEDRGPKEPAQLQLAGAVGASAMRKMNERDRKRQRNEIPSGIAELRETAAKGHERGGQIPRPIGARAVEIGDREGGEEEGGTS